MRDSLCNCLALHGGEGFSVNLEKWYQYAIKWMESLGSSIDNISIEAPDFPNEIVPFRELERRLDTRALSRIKEITLYGGSRQKKQLMFDWIVQCSADESERTVSFFYDSELSCDFKGDLMTLVSNAISFTRFQYGYGFQKQYSKGPDMYIYGVSTGLEFGSKATEEADRIARWMYLKTDERVSRLRDVYPLNVLTNRHLDMQMKHESLKNWITKKKKRGTLEQLNEMLWVWHVDDRHISKVADVLAKHGLLSCR